MNYAQNYDLHWGEQSFKKLFLITMNYAQNYDLFFPFFIKEVVNKSKAYSFLIIGIMHVQKILSFQFMTMADLKKGSLNCRGISSDKIKRRDIFHYCRQNYDLIFLIDTHSTEKEYFLLMILLTKMAIFIVNKHYVKSITYLLHF